MATMACLYCNKPVAQNEPMNCCLECDWVHTIRIQALDELFHYEEEEYQLKQRLIDVRKRRKAAMKQYEEMWKEMDDRQIG
jgi:hypothetical protein